MKVLVTGATGFVGKRVVAKLLANKHEVIVVSRNAAKALNKFGEKVKYFQWENFKEIPDLSAHDFDSVIHLAGENIGDKRWSDSQKEKIKVSRIDGTHNLILGIKNAKVNLQSFVSTSAIGIYTKNHNDAINEKSSLDNDFLGEVCKQWESALDDLPSETKKTILRVGVVLGEDGGMLKKLLPIFKLGLGGPIGNGSQEMSWVHVDDLADLYVAVLEQKLEGLFNAVSSNPVSNKEFTKAFGKAVKRPAFFPVPPFALKVMMGEMSCIALDSQKIYPENLKNLGHKFKYDTIEAALKEICA